MSQPNIPLSVLIKAAHGLKAAMDSGQLSGKTWLEVMSAQAHLQTYLDAIVAPQRVTVTTEPTTP